MWGPPRSTGEQRDGGDEVAAGAVADQREARGVELELGGVCGDPIRGGVAFFDGDGVAGFGGAGVIDEDDRGAGAGGELAEEAVVRVGVVEDPAAAVEIDDRGKGALLAALVDRADDADRDFVPRGRQEWCGLPSRAAGASTGTAWRAAAVRRASATDCCSSGGMPLAIRPSRKARVVASMRGAKSA